MGLIDLERNIDLALANDSICNSMFTDANIYGNTVFDATNIATTPVVLQLKSVPAVGGGVAASDAPGNIVFALAPKLTVATKGITFTIDNLAAGTLSIQFDQKKLLRLMRK